METTRRGDSTRVLRGEANIERFGRLHCRAGSVRWCRDSTEAWRFELLAVQVTRCRLFPRLAPSLRTRSDSRTSRGPDPGTSRPSSPGEPARELHMATTRYSPPTTSSTSAPMAAGAPDSNASSSQPAAPRPFALSSSYSTTAGTGNPTATTTTSSSTSNKMRASVDALSWRQNAAAPQPHHHALPSNSSAASAAKRGSSPGRTVSSSGLSLRPASEYLGASSGYGAGHGAPHERGHSYGGTSSAAATTTTASESESRLRSVGLGRKSPWLQVTDSVSYGRYWTRPSSRG